jgi:hypothetical protein
VEDGAREHRLPHSTMEDLHGVGGETGVELFADQYFANLFEEVQQEISTQYWTYVAHKVKTFEQAELRASTEN